LQSKSTPLKERNKPATMQQVIRVSKLAVSGIAVAAVDEQEERSSLTLLGVAVKFLERSTMGLPVVPDSQNKCMRQSYPLAHLPTV
jgi:hypothetical protein